MTALRILFAWPVALSAALLPLSPALAAPPPAPAGLWVTAHASSDGIARCTLARSDGASRIVIETVDARVEIQAWSDAFHTHPSMTYDVMIALDGEAPIATRGGGRGEHGVVLAPGEGLTGDALLARMARAASMTVTESIWTKRFDLGGLADALPKLEDCRKTEGERAATERARIAEAAAASARACEALIQAIHKDVGGMRSDKSIAHPSATISVACSSTEKPSVGVRGMENGFPPEFLQVAARVAADLSGQPAGATRDAPARCLERVTGFYKMGKVGRHHPPSADTPRVYEGTLTIPGATIQCRYVGADKRDPSFWIGGR